MGIQIDSQVKSEGNGRYGEEEGVEGHPEQDDEEVQHTQERRALEEQEEGIFQI